MIIALLFLLLVFLNGVDLLLTRKIIRRGGKELNPFMKNPKLWIPLKAGSSIVCLIISLLTSWVALVVPNLLMIGVCVWNYRQLRK